MSLIHFVLLAGGSGSRVGAETPKQVLPLGERPVLAYSLETFLNWGRLGNLVLVSRPDIISRTELLARDIQDRNQRQEVTLSVVGGGATRHSSTLNGVLKAREGASDEDLIFIHDAARPFIDYDELNALANSLRDNPDFNIASLAASVTETVVEGEGLPGAMVQRLERSRVFAVKTPQAVRVAALERLLSQEEDESFTDLLSWGAGANMPGYLVEAGPANQKLTTPEDYRRMRILLEAEEDGYPA